MFPLNHFFSSVYLVGLFLWVCNKMISIPLPSVLFEKGNIFVLCQYGFHSWIPILLIIIQLHYLFPWLLRLFSKESVCFLFLVMENVLILNLVIQFLILIRLYCEISFKPSLLSHVSQDIISISRVLWSAGYLTAKNAYKLKRVRNASGKGVVLQLFFLFFQR